MAVQNPMPKHVLKYLKDNMIGESINDLIIRSVLGSGNTAITFEVEDTYGIPWAVKCVTFESYGDRAPFREIARFAKAKDKRFLIFPIEIKVWSLDLRGETHEFYCFKSECVRGQTLKAFFESDAQFSAKTEIIRYMENIGAGLEELMRLGFSHGDLHNRNIMRTVIGEGSQFPEIRYVIIDFSEAHPIDEVELGLEKDIENFGKHLRCFYDAVSRREIISRDDEKILTAISHIPGLLNGTAPESLGISRPLQVLERFKDGLRSTEESPRKLTDPFHPLSSENISNEALLADLCLRMSWVSELEKNDNILLIGPRGCGKTMIFKRLRLKTKIAANKTKEIKDDSYVGFYLPCESLFFMRFSDLSDIDIFKYKNALILYFNMGVLNEVASSIAAISEILGLVPQSLPTTITSLMKDEIGAICDEIEMPSTITTLEEISAYSENVMRYIRKSIAYNRQIVSIGSIDFLRTLVEIVKREIPGLSQRFFIFFLDDYTEERVPLALQEALHPIVCQRSSDISFKISAHMFGSIYNNPRPLALDEGRNINVINLGSVYLNRNKRRKEGKLLLDILDARFKNCEGYEGNIEDWLGKTIYPGGRTLSFALNDVHTRSKVHYHGVHCLMGLCTGDYSEMIRMVGEIFKEANIVAGTPVRKIPANIQDKAIVRVSREFLGRIRHIRPDGQKLFNVVESFGKLSQKLLYEKKLIGQGKDKRGKPRKDPYDVLTIYVDNLTKASKASRLVWERLQKASIFVDIGLAPSQRTVVSDRATLRRIYCPAFKTTLTSSEHLQPTKDQFEWFMDMPEEFYKDYLKRVTEESEAPTLWGKEIKEETSMEEPLTGPTFIPDIADFVDYISGAPENWDKYANLIPDLKPIDDVIVNNSNYDLYLGAIGFEERTTCAIDALKRKQIRVKNAILFEFDRYFEATQIRKEKYEISITDLTAGKPYRPMNAPVGDPDPIFIEKLTSLLNSLAKSEKISILFDLTSCPSLILSNTLAVLLRYPCNLTILYSEAEEYFPTLEEWESGKLKPPGMRVQGPFKGVRYVAKPPILQADDIGELPVLLVIFPTFNTERTDGILAELDPAARIWLFGEPHDLEKNSYRIEMAKSFAAPIYYPGDSWSMVSTFDFKKTLLTLAWIYKENRFKYRIVVVPHGSKMQTLGVNIFTISHEISMIFAMPKDYDPKRYSKGCLQVWGVYLGDTQELVKNLLSDRIISRKNHFK